MSKIYYAIKKRVLTVFGDIKVFRWPLFIIYHPIGYRVKGRQTRAIMAALQPGDVVMRAYNNYLDGYFIPKGASGCSHSGLYVGDGQVVHSIAEGSTLDDVIDFCRCDRVIVLRPKDGTAWAVDHARKCADRRIPYDFDFVRGAGKYYCHEFTASCYPGLGIETLSRKAFGCISSPKVFLADSFYSNPNFAVVYDSAKAD